MSEEFGVLPRKKPLSKRRPHSILLQYDLIPPAIWVTEHRNVLLSLCLCVSPLRPLLSVPNLGTPVFGSPRTSVVVDVLSPFWEETSEIGDGCDSSDRGLGSLFHEDDNTRELGTNNPVGSLGAGTGLWTHTSRRRPRVSVRQWESLEGRGVPQGKRRSVDSDVFSWCLFSLSLSPCHRTPAEE